MDKAELVGKIVSGSGEGEKYIRLAWVQQQIRNKLDFSPFCGTLNLRLDENSTRLRKRIEKKASLRICHSEGYCTGLLFKASINGLACGLVIPQLENYPRNLLEVIAPVSLRQQLNLQDDDRIEVTVFL